MNTEYNQGWLDAVDAIVGELAKDIDKQRLCVNCRQQKEFRMAQRLVDRVAEFRDLQTVKAKQADRS